MTFVFAVGENPFILVGVFAAIVLAIAYGYYARGNSDITQRPHDGRGDAPGASGPSSISTTDDDVDVERTFDTHGTR